MTPERWREVKAVLAEALELQGEARARLLAEAGASDPALRREVEELLAGEEAAAPLTARIAMAVAAAADPTSEVGTLVGPYRLEAEVGRGGMGTVYLARRADGQYEASVAVKLARRDMDAAQATARFRLERQYLAALEHPFIARLLDGGVTPDGRLYLAMEYVDGETIDAYCASHALGLEERLQLFRKVAAAVGYAHQRLIVHRDLKPSNVVVCRDGTPKLVDFGIAKLLDPELRAGAGAMTLEAGRFLTPGYASPEQRAGVAVTTVSDVYSLGVLLHEVLAGGLPRSGAAAEGATGGAGEPMPVSGAAALRERAPGSPAFPFEARRLRGDLDRIVAKALRSAPEERYQSAAELGEDLRRFLEGEPIRARAPTFGYRARKFVRRNALAVGMSGALVLTLLAGGVLYALEARATALARSLAARRGEFLEKVLKSANPVGGRRDVTVAELLDGAAGQLAATRDEDPMVAASMFGLVADTNLNLGRYRQAIEASERALALLRGHGGAPAELAELLLTRGESQRDDGQLGEAAASQREALALLAGLRGSEGRRANAYDQLGISLKQAGQEKEAEAAYRSAIGLYGALQDRGGEGLASPLTNLGVLLEEQGRYAEASAMEAEALSIVRKALPADHPHVLAVEQNYAGSLMGRHAPLEAEPLLRHVVETRARILGAEHKDTLFSTIELVDCLVEQHRHAEAAALGRSAAEAMQRVAGPEHLATLYAWHTYATAACQTDQAPEGLAALRRVETARVKRYGSSDWHTASTRVGIGVCLIALRRFREAEPPLLEAARELETARGASFHRTQAAYRALQELYASLGRAGEADRWAAKVAP